MYLSAFLNNFEILFPCFDVESLEIELFCSTWVDFTESAKTLAFDIPGTVTPAKVMVEKRIIPVLFKDLFKFKMKSS